MSFGFPTFVILFTQILGTICGHAEHAPYSLVDVAHKHRFELEVRSRMPEWYREGMQLFSYELLNAKWKKKRITWGLQKETPIIEGHPVLEEMKRTFGKWAAVTSLEFIGPVRQPDIELQFVERMGDRAMCKTTFVDDGHYENGIHILDYGGAKIIFNDDINWRNPNHYDFHNPIGALLHEIGHALGLDNSPVREAIMYRDPPLRKSGTNYQLHEDDIKGIQSLYGPPSSGTSWNRPQPPVSGSQRRQAPTSSSSESSSTSSSQASSSDSSSNESGSD